MIGHRLRRWPITGPALSERVVFACSAHGTGHVSISLVYPCSSLSVSWWSGCLWSWSSKQTGQDTCLSLSGLSLHHSVRPVLRWELCTYRLNWARITSWRCEMYDMALSSRQRIWYSNPCWSESEHASSWLQMVSTILNLYESAEKNHFVSSKLKRQLGLVLNLRSPIFQGQGPACRHTGAGDVSISLWSVPLPVCPSRG